jgi:hypothetical protein
MSKIEKRLALEDLKRRQNKEIAKAAKKQHKQAQHALANPVTANVIDTNDTLDCACLIHGTGYDWQYVETLYNMLTRNCTKKIRLHVYTEESRSVPEHMIKHVLKEWKGVSGPRLSWWYKMQMFNQEHHSGPMLYFDLDVVIVRNIDWVTELPTRYFWAIKDFRYLWRGNHNGINSSIMWWDTRRFHHIWQEFANQNIDLIRKRYHGDQDYISAHVTDIERRNFDQKHTQSWRWEALDGGMNFTTRVYKRPNTGTTIGAETSVLIFHGNPKPHELTDPEIVKYWN